MCTNLNLSSCHQLESRVRSKVHARFGEGPTEKGRNVPRWRPALLQNQEGNSLNTTYLIYR